MTLHYPVPFAGKQSGPILDTDTIKMLSKLDVWQGVGGNGMRDHLQEQLRRSVEAHKSYVNDHFPAGEFRDMALQTAKDVLTFFTFLTTYISEEIEILTSLGLPVAEVMLLLSNQVVQICDDMYEYRHLARNINLDNKAIAGARYAWVTLQSLGTLAGYLKDKFRRHQGIHSTFVRFLTRNLASQSCIGLSAQIKALATRVTKVETSLTTLTANTTKEKEKLDAKVESILRANPTLKRN